MPRKSTFTKDEVISAALALVRSGGMEALTARALGKELGCSSKPVFGLFENMDEVRNAVIPAAHAIFTEYIENSMKSGKYPPYKASGMAYIRFAKEETELFRLLFMRDRTKEPPEFDREGRETTEAIGLVGSNVGLNSTDARLFHLQMWIYVHGVASMTATGFLDFDEETVSNLLSEIYMSLKSTKTRAQNNSSAPQSPAADVDASDFMKNINKISKDALKNDENSAETASGQRKEGN